MLRHAWLTLSLAIYLANSMPWGSLPKASAQDVPAEKIAFFENEVRPTLAQHCYPCHGPDKQKAGLRLDSLAAMLEGGESGPAIELGNSKNSLIAQAIRYESLQMPPTGKLPANKTNAILKWIDENAPAPADFAAPKDSPDTNSHNSPSKHRKSNEISPEDRAHWAFQPIQRVPPPASPNKPHPIDRWIEHRLEQEHIQPLEPASAPILIRRVFYTLTGLPPSYEELEHWSQRIQKDSPQAFDEHAYLQLIDDLLSRTAYAEHWARHWLDIVRFAQSNGYERDGYKPHAWRYRDYVIESLAKDKPYDRFILEQLAGDELADANSESRIATGFYRLGVWDDEPDDKRQAEFDDLDDSMVSIGSAFLGLSIGCARCHDHKFDPIPQDDYYRLLGCIRNIQRYSNPENHIDNASSFPLESNEQIRQKTTDYLQRKSSNTQPLDPTLGISAWALTVRESSNPPPATHLLVRGNASSPGPVVEPGFLSVLSQSPASEDPTTKFHPSESPLNDLFPTSGRRLALARWIAHPGHPLTARVLVNRLWHYHFGRGIVATTADFGVAGSSPTHPELLDHLASVLIDNRWSIKQLHRYILTSDAFKRSSHFDPDANAYAQALRIDPGNRLLWRQNLKRLQAESIRDSMLYASGQLNTQTFGKEMFPRLSAEVLAGQSKPGLGWESSPTKDQLRRSIYAIVKRSVRDPLLESFDYSNTTTPLTERPQTTVAPQALMLLNSRFSTERAQAIAQRAASESPTLEQQIQLAYRWTLQRDPSSEELRDASTTIDRMTEDYLPLAEQIHFRTDVPVSLFSGYRQQLAPSDFLIGPQSLSREDSNPASPWIYFAGSWGGGYEGIDVVDKRFGPHAILEQQPFRDGQLRCKLRISRTTEIATLLLRAKTEGNRFQGIALRLDPSNELLCLENLQGEKTTQARLHHKIPVDQWLDLRFQVVGGTAQVWLDNDGNTPLLELQFESSESPNLANPVGSLGVALWGGTLSMDQAQLNILDQDRLSHLKSVRLAYATSANKSDRLFEGWTRYAGQWSLQSDGILSVAAEQGPKLVWDSEPLSKGRASIEMKVHSQHANIGGLILRVSEPKIGADNWLGYEISLNMAKKTVLFGEHRNNWQPLAEVPADIQTDRWHKLAVEIDTDSKDQTVLRVYLDQKPEPILAYTLSDPLPGNLVGLRTWGSQIDYRNLSVQKENREIQPRWQESTNAQNDERQTTGVENESQIKQARLLWAKRKAFEMFCRTLMNLNEFLYID